jgi:RNA-directed DNA polymerase
MEGRNLGNIRPQKGNVEMTAERQYTTENKLKRIAWLSAQGPNKEFQCLMHLYNQESLAECFHMLDGRKAVGLDKIDKTKYGENLQSNLEDLMVRMKRMGYKPGPVRQVLIPKEGKPGATRPLGIGNFEDKIVQKMTQRILESVYDPIFLDCSHGFRPERSCHTAIKSLQDYLFRNDIEVVIDVDIKNFFGAISHDWLVKMLRHKIKDEKFIRYLIRQFKAGVMAEGELTVDENGVPQGSPCSPVLANVFAHYVIDLWIEKVARIRCKGHIHMVRYADDMVICCESAEDALWIKEAFTGRLNKFNLCLHPEKTKVIEFSKRKARMGINQDTFDFLGFTFFWGKSRKGVTIPKLKTRGKTFRAKLKKMNAWAKDIRNKEMLLVIWNTYRRKLKGHYQYYGVSHNSDSLNKFKDRSLRLLFKWLNRRSQRRSMTWVKFASFMQSFPCPEPRINFHLF